MTVPTQNLNDSEEEDFQVVKKNDNIDLIFLGHGDKVSSEKEDQSILKIGDHIASPRFGGIYNHHGVYIGDDKVVHCTGELKDGSPVCLGGSKVAWVQIDELSKFQYGSKYYIVNRINIEENETPIFFEKVRENLGKIDYSIVNNNCEHFAHRLTIGEHKSLQVRHSCGAIISTITGAGSGGILKSVAIIPYVSYPIVIGGAIGTFIYGLVSWFLGSKKA